MRRLSVLLLAALAGPAVVRSVPDRRSVLYVVDRSASVTTPPRRIEQFIARQNRSRLTHSDRYGVLACADGVARRVPYPTAPSVRPTVDSGGPATGKLHSRIHEGLKAARTTLEKRSCGTIVLLSDGHFDRHRAMRESEYLKHEGFDLEVVRLDCASPRDVSVTSLLMPTTVRQGAIVPIRAVIENSGPPTEARIEFVVDGRTVKAESETLPQGTAVKNLSLPAVAPGRHVVCLRVRPNDPAADEIVDNNERLAALNVVGKTHVLFLEGRPGVSRHVQEALVVAHVAPEVHGPEVLADGGIDLDDYDVVALVNVPASAVPERAVERLERYVRRGGGLVVYGGDQAFDGGAYRNSALEQRLLPVRSAEEHPGNDKAVGMFILLVDISGSMEGQPLQMAKEVGILTLERLRPGMAASVIGFDAGAFVVAQPQVITPGSVQAMIQKVNGLNAAGGTRIGPALDEARKALELARRRPGFERLAAHLVIISDGEAEEQAELEDRARHLKQVGCRVHTVLIGDVPSDRARTLMKAVAAAGGGRCEQYAGRNPPAFELTDKEVREENARLDFQRDPADVIFPPDLESKLVVPEHGMARRLLDAMVWDYNRITALTPAACRSLAVCDPRSGQAGGNQPVYVWHYVGGATGGRVAALTIDVEGPWSRGLLESPVRDLLLADPLFFCRRRTQQTGVAISLEHDAFQAEEVVVTLCGQIGKDALIHLVPGPRGAASVPDEIIPLFRSSPTSYGGRFRCTGSDRIFEFSVQQTLPGGAVRTLGDVLGVLNPPLYNAERVGNEPNEQTLAALANRFGNKVKTLSDAIDLPQQGQRTDRSRVRNLPLTIALLLLLLAGTLVRLEPPRSAWWCWTALGSAVGFFAFGVWYAMR
ncbi:MAG TPA: VWA domain-containing protein [Planctomycetaceae bacterium]|nr:VWA domain-containing protein [Planctomycetaceae bacterium]